MLVERRRSVRREVNLPGKVDAGRGSQHDCVILNISDSGALLAIKAARDMPDEFTVIMSPSGAPARRCRLVWRTSEHLGVEFDDQWHRNHPHGKEHEREFVAAAGY